MDIKNKIEFLEATTVQGLQQQVDEYQEHLPVTKEIVDLCFQVDKGKFYAAITIGELQKKHTEDKKEEKPKGKASINLMGG